MKGKGGPKSLTSHWDATGGSYMDHISLSHLSARGGMAPVNRKVDLPPSTALSIAAWNLGELLCLERDWKRCLLGIPTHSRESSLRQRKSNNHHFVICFLPAHTEPGGAARYPPHPQASLQSGFETQIVSARFSIKDHFPTQHLLFASLSLNYQKLPESKQHSQQMSTRGPGTWFSKCFVTRL